MNRACLASLGLLALLLFGCSWGAPVRARGAGGPQPGEVRQGPAAGHYFISPGGSDTNDGRSPASAWASFAHVRAGDVAPGSVILAEAGGVWQETVRVPVGNLSFGVYGDGPRPRIVAPDGQYAFDGNWKPGTMLQGWELTSATRRGGRWGIVLMAANDYVVRDVVVHGADGWMFMSRGVRGLVERSEFYDNDGGGPTSAASVGGFEDQGRPSPSDVTVFRDNRVHDTGYVAVANWGSNVVIEHNRIERWSKAEARGSDTQAPAGISISSRYLGNVVVRGNLLLGTGVEERAIWVDTGPEDQTVVEGNVAANARHCFWSEKTDNVIFRGNTCSFMSKSGIDWGSGDLWERLLYHPSRNGQITGNTFVGPTPEAGWIRLYPGASAEVRDNVYR